MKKTTTPYDRVWDISRQAQTLQSTLSLLHWDQETCMPSDSEYSRGEQIALLADIQHKKKTSPAFAKALARLIDIDTGKILEPQLSEEKAAAAVLWRRDYLQTRKLPAKFVAQWEKLVSQATHVWAKARKEDTFLRLAPYLERIFEMAQQKAEYLGYEDHPYDALLDTFEPGMTHRKMQKVFDSLKERMQALVANIAASPQVDDAFLHRSYPKESVMKFCHELMQRMGFDFSKGRLDFSAHPFSCAMHPTDSRVTTRFDENNLATNIATIMHETGHGLYEMGLPAEHFGSPLGEAVSLAIHESQSRFWETRIGQSLPFWKYQVLRLKEFLYPQLDGISAEKIYRAVNKVQPSFIRVDADEVTYTMHVLLRFELESALVDKTLKVRDLPEAWNEKMERYLGIRPPTNTLGCLQDIHWSSGLIGYFPTYCLGNLYASQIWSCFAKDHTDWQAQIEAGQLQFITLWMQRHVYCHGRRYSAEQLIEKISGEPLNPEYFLSYLENKYRDIYSF